MINNPLFRKFKENSLWWVLIAVFTLLLGVVTVSQDSGVIDQSRIFAEQSDITIDIEERVSDNVTLYIITIKKDGKLINEDPIITDFDPRDNERGRQLLEEALRENEGININADDYPEIEPPVDKPSLEDQIKNTKLATVRITKITQDGKYMGSGFSIGEFHTKDGKKWEYIITNWHVVNGDSDKKFPVEIFDINGKVIKTVIGLFQYSDKASDLAMIAIPAVNELPSVLISSTPPKPGDLVYQVGCADGGKPVYFPTPGTMPISPEHLCVVVKSNWSDLAGEVVFMHPRGLGVIEGRSGGGVYHYDKDLGRWTLVAVCNSRSKFPGSPTQNRACSSDALNDFIDKINYDAILKQQAKDRQALIEAQK